MNQINKFFFSIAVTILLLSFFSCVRDSKIYNVSFYEFPASGLIPSKDYIFYPFENWNHDSINNIYNLFLVVRYTDQCKLKYLKLNVESSSFNYDSIHNEVVKIDLFDNDNHFCGKGGFGFYENSFPIIKNQPFDENLSIAVSSAEKDTKGIIALGLLCK